MVSVFLMVMGWTTAPLGAAMGHRDDKPLTWDKGSLYTCQVTQLYESTQPGCFFRWTRTVCHHILCTLSVHSWLLGVFVFWERCYRERMDGQMILLGVDWRQSFSSLSSGRCCDWLIVTMGMKLVQGDKYREIFGNKTHRNDSVWSLPSQSKQQPLLSPLLKCLHVALSQRACSLWIPAFLLFQCCIFVFWLQRQILLVWLFCFTAAFRVESSILC